MKLGTMMGVPVPLVRALHAWGSFGNHPAMFVIDPEGVIRFVDFATAASKNDSNRRPGGGTA
jgi:hypothetical protein